jgi:cytochrome o ubiquinol oxidase subunit 2
MKIKLVLIATALGIILTAYAVYWYIANNSISLLDPKGEIANSQYDLLVFASVLSLIVIIPVYVMLLGFAWRYRANNKKAKYKPNWDSSKLAESIWWGIPIVLIFILSVVTWQTSHSLDPYKPLESSKKPLSVQVVALQWKWLFIYPEYGVATVNELTIPEKTPINFYITADAPMNSFWIPDLGGQIYAMAGMQTKLHLMADSTGTYNGYSSNLSGEGFAKMNFKVNSVAEFEYNSWLQDVALSTKALDTTSYKVLAEPSIIDSPIYFGSVQPELFTDIIDSYMHNHSAKKHDSSHSGEHDHHNHDHEMENN